MPSGSELKAVFQDIVPVQRPSSVLEDCQIKDPPWLVGFIEAEGCFYVGISKNSNYNAGSRVKLIFKLTQHSRAEQLMKSLIEYLNCGNVYKNRETVDFQITKFNDLTNKVIPFFQKYPIQGVKSKDFEDFCKVAKMMK